MKKYIVFFVILLSIMSIAAGVSSAADGKKAVDKRNNAEIKFPENLGDCFAILKETLSQEKLEKLKNSDTINYHFTLGLWIRNNWIRDNRCSLGEYFNKIGVFHIDDVSGIILATFKSYLNGQDINLKELLNRNVDTWHKDGHDDIAITAPDSLVKVAERSVENKAGFKNTSEQLKDLGNYDPVTRIEAVVRIGRSGNPKLADSIIPLLRDKDAGVRIEAMYAFMRLDPERCRASIEGMKKDENSLVKRNAEIIIEKLDIKDKRAGK